MFKSAHRVTAMIVGLFIVLHLANHMVGLVGQQQHIQFMTLIRPLYRNPVAETVLLALLVWQILSGMRLLALRWRNNDGIISWLQIISGGYLAIFLIIHVSSVLYARHSMGMDTNFYFAAAGLHIENGDKFFVPYYTGSFLALFTHIGCASSWYLFPQNSRKQLRWIGLNAVLGFVAGILVVAALSGKLYTVVFPT
ncbi:MAG: hypothetical protein ACKVOS_04365 [Sphingorhabdus sp.]|uniref:hypothetical protein n=1 Tax=Sphingorhabdus sp. TaxID=1902408 RepID=UPI0038FCD060